MADRITKRVASVFLDAKDAELVQKRLAAEAKHWADELARVPQGSKAALEASKKLAQVQGHYARITKEIQGSNAAINRSEALFGRLSAMVSPLGGVIAGALGGVAVLGSIKRGVEAFHEHEQAVARVGTALKNAGDVGGVSLRNLEEQADRLQNTSLFSDEAILDGVTTRMVSFGNIAGDNLMRANEVAVDLATTMKGDLSGAAQAIGKALNSPVEGMQALQRIGVRLSDDQKALVKDLAETGRTAEAQAVILGELEKRYKGQAAAQAEALGGSRRMAVAMDELSEAIGARFAGGLSTTQGLLANLVNGLADFIAPAKSAVEQWQDQDAAVKSLTTNVAPLLDRYDELAGQTVRSSDEQAEMERIIKQVGAAIPLAVTQFNEYGDAIGLSTDKARDFIANQKDLLAFTNAEAIKETETQLKSLTAQQQRAQEFINGLNTTLRVNGEEYLRTADGVVKLEEDVRGLNAEATRVKLSQQEQTEVLGDAGKMLNLYTSQVNGAQQQIALLNGTMAEADEAAKEAAEATEEATKRMAQVAEFIAGARKDLEMDRLEGQAKEIEQARQHFAEQMALAGDNAAQQTELADLFEQKVAQIRAKYGERELERLRKLDADIQAVREEHEAWKLGRDEQELEAIRNKYDKLFEAAQGNAARTMQVQALMEEELERKRQEQAAKRQEQADELLASEQEAQVQVTEQRLRAIDERYALEIDKAGDNQELVLDLMRRHHEERAELQAELDQAAVDAVNLQFETLYAQFDAAGLSTTELQRLHGEALLALKGEQNNREIAERDATNAKVVESDHRAAEARRLVATQLFGMVNDLLSMAGENEGSWAEFQKLVALAQIAVDTASAISSLTAASEANPANALTFGGAGTAQFISGLARITANMAKAASLLNRKDPEPPKFAAGGPTGQPSVSAGGSVNSPTLGWFGEAGPEWVAPSWMYTHPSMQPVFQHLEAVRSTGRVPAFADGGATNASGGSRYTFTKATGMSEQDGATIAVLVQLTNAVNNLTTRLNRPIVATRNYDLEQQDDERLARIEASNNLSR